MNNKWTAEEDEIILANLNMPIKVLYKLIPGRTDAGIATRKTNLLCKSGKHRQPREEPEPKKTLPADYKPSSLFEAMPDSIKVKVEQMKASAGTYKDPKSLSAVVQQRIDVIQNQPPGKVEYDNRDLEIVYLRGKLDGLELAMQFLKAGDPR